MDFKRVFAVGLVLALPLSAIAKPGYLKCTLDGAEDAFDVSVDEQEGRVTVQAEPAFTDAKFTATEISFERETGDGSDIEHDEYTIDRRSLEYRHTRLNVNLNAGTQKETRTTGRCEVSKIPVRKI